jgi:cephalosporin-C deacetylase-like acetyl esterase
LFKPIERRAVRDLTKVTAHTEEEFHSYKQFYSYDRTDLEAQIESIDKSPIHWHTEKITFNAAYGNERVIIYLCIPKEGKPPFQPVVYFPGGGARAKSKCTDLHDLNGFDFIVRSGRAFLWPIYKGTYERRIEQGWPNAIKGSSANRDWSVQVYQDLARSIDYLESRDDIDLEKLTYLGLSWGAIDGHVLVALEDRIRKAIFVAGGCWVWHDSYHPAADPAKFAGHIKVPTIMLNGIYDEICPYETSQKPTFELLGTPAKHKVLNTYPCGHPIIGLFREEFKHDVLEWLDR